MSNKIKSRRNPSHGIAHIRSSFTKTMITVTDVDSNAISWVAASLDNIENAVTTLAKAVMDKGIKSVEIIVKGPGKGRESAIRTLMDAGLDITMIKDTTPIPHNGCRPKSRQRRR